MSRPVRRSIVSRLMAACAAAATLVSCLPEDKSTERGGVEITLAAGPFEAKTAAAGVTARTTEVVLDRLVMLAGASVPECHATYYIARPPPPTAVLDMRKPYVFEHRSLVETHCKVNAGFIKIEQPPARGDGVTPEEYLELYTEGITGFGAMRLTASVKITYKTLPPEAKRFEIFFADIRGLQVTTTDVPRGDKVSKRFVFDTTQMLLALPGMIRFDRDGDGTVTLAELDGPRQALIRSLAEVAWRETPVEVPSPSP